ncbi:MAG: alpha-glucan family phosphorylase [Clostridia bacterium]
MYIFNKVKVNPQLPKQIEELGEVANNLWWSWNTEFLKIFKQIDIDLWERCDKNPVKFLKLVDQEKLEKAAKDEKIVKQYELNINNFKAYMQSKNTWFNKTYPENKNDLIAYFSAEYGLDETLPIYSGGLGILSGDHLKSASDLGIPLVAVGLLYKNGYFHQIIDRNGSQQTQYKDIDLDNMPIYPVKTKTGENLIVNIKMDKETIYIKVWKICVGRVNLYLLDTDIPENKEGNRGITLRLYGGDQDMRIKQEIVLGIGGVAVLKELGLNPTVYHMNEGHSSFLVLETIKNIIEEKKVSFNIAKDIVTSKTVFTTHTPVPAGNDIFPVELVEKYFNKYWEKLGITKEEFLELGMKPKEQNKTHFNMGILALKIAGKKNGVSKLHGEVSRELFSEVWPEISPKESPITYVTNGVHTCSWLAPNLKNLYNEYLEAYWQDKIYDNKTWEKIKDIPNERLWKEHQERKIKLLELVKKNVTERLKNSGMRYDEIREITSKLNPNALTIGFARRFATYKRATLIFKDLERITEILNDEERPVQLIFAGKAHPKDVEGQNLIRRIHEISMMPQFKGKIILLENYNIGIARHLVSGVDVWLNNPRRPMEASGTSGEKASVNGVVNFSVLDGWWAEGYNTKNGWAIGTNKEFDSYEEQDIADSESIYNTLENKIIPAYYNKDENGISKQWMEYMKNSIISTGGNYSTSRMLVDYTNNLYMPLCKLTNKYYNDLGTVTEFNQIKESLYANWDDIVITQVDGNADDVTIDAGNKIRVACRVKLPNIAPENIEVQSYCGRILENGTLENISIVPMKLIESDEENKVYTYETDIAMKTGGNYGYTFRVMPKLDMLLDSENLNLVKWITK